MLKELALNYYYANITSKNKNHSITFDDVCASMMNYFEDAEYKRSILNKWNNLILKSIMKRTQYEEKSMNKCLQLLIKELRHLQHDLESTLRIDDFIHNKLINACQKISACQYACFKFSDILTELINDLKSSIIIYQKAHFIEFSFVIEFTLFIDRRYHRNFSSRINQNKENRECQDRGHQNRKYQNREYQNRRNQSRTRKVCFVWQKEECWSTKHTRNEREDAKRKFKNRFLDQMNKRIDQYIAEYEELEDENDQNTNDELINEIEALMIEFSSFSLFEKNENAETFMIIFKSMKNFELMIIDLINRSLTHYLIDVHTDMKNQTLTHLQISLKIETLIVHTDMKNTNLDPFAYVMTFDRYISEKFYEVMIDSDVSTKSTTEYEQYLAFNNIDLIIDLDSTKTETVNIQFDIGSARSIESLIIDTSFEIVKFHVIKTDISFLLSLADMNRLKVYFNNVINSLIQMIKISDEILRKKKSFSVIRRFDHEFLLWRNFMQIYVNQSFDLNSCYVIEIELRQLHKRFDHSSTMKLHHLLERFEHEAEKSVLKKLTKFCTFCQKYAKFSERFKFILKDDVNFNYSMIVNVMYIEKSSILHVVDEATRFQAIKWLQNISAKHTWKMLRLCWIDVYLKSSDHILHDADKNFVSREFRQFVISMTIIIKIVSIETHWSIDIVKRYHAELRRAYQMIFENLDNETDISKKIVLQMIVKAVNDTADSDDLMLTLLIFDAYSRTHIMNSSISSINQRAITIKKVMTEVRKFRAERQVADALNIRNDSIITSINDLLLNSNVLIWRENNNQRDKWIESFKFLDIEDEICKIVLSSKSIDFRSTVIKSFLIDLIIEDESFNKNVQSTHSSDVENQDFASEIPTRSTRARRLLLRYQNFADITVFLQDDEEISSSLTSTFAESRLKEINDLLKRQVFETIIIFEVSKNIRIFNFRFVDEIKHSDISQAYEKSRLVIQVYNDHEETLVLTQAFIIQRMSQRIILVIAASINHHLYLRDIIQTYTQSKSCLNRMFFICSSLDLGLFDDAILRVIKSLYDVSKAKAHWFNTYHTHHKENLNMTKSTFDSCLLFITQINQNESSNNLTNQSTFELIEMQTDDILMLKDDRFVELEENELKKAKLTFKKRKMLITLISIKFNDEIIIIDSSSTLILNQLKQFDQIRLINMSISTDLISSRNQIRKMMTSKNQYVAQRARRTYIVTMTQSKVAFDLFLTAQITTLKEEDAKRLNKRLQWQLNHSIRELKFVRLNIISSSLQLMIFIDVSFANVNLHFQIDYVICLVNDQLKANIIHWFFTKCKKVIRSVLAAELYAMTNEFDSDSIIKSIVERILNISLLMILLTDSRSLYDCLVKLSITSEKRLMIDLMCLRQSYKRKKITKIRWIDDSNNLVDVMTKINSCQTLDKLIDTNVIDLKISEWVERVNERIIKGQK